MLFADVYKVKLSFCSQNLRLPFFLWVQRRRQPAAHFRAAEVPGTSQREGRIIGVPSNVKRYAGKESGSRLLEGLGVLLFLKLFLRRKCCILTKENYLSYAGIAPTYTGLIYIYSIIFMQTETVRTKAVCSDVPCKPSSLRTTCSNS
jgi:hypothetical protein